MPSTGGMSTGTPPHAKIADRIEVNDTGILVFVGVSSPVPFGRVIFEPVTLEVEQANGASQTFGDALQEVIGATDVQVVAVEWQRPEELVRIGTHTFHSWNITDGDPPVVHFASVSRSTAGPLEMSSGC